MKCLLFVHMSIVAVGGGVSAPTQTKFVLFAQPRGGSTWFETMLASVPGICAYFELLTYASWPKKLRHCTAEIALEAGVSQKLKSLTGRAYTDSNCFYITNPGRKKKNATFMQNWSVPEYLDHLHARDPRVHCCSHCDASVHSVTGATATGYKLMPNQLALHEAHSPGLNMFQTMEDTSTFVILFRRRPLARYISGRHVAATGINRCNKGCDINALRRVKVHIDTRQLLKFIAGQDKGNRAMDARLHRYPRLRVLNLTYEAFSNSPDWCHVLEFLQMPCVKHLSSPLQKKSGNATLASRVSNAREVRTALSKAGRLDLLHDFDSASR